MVESASFRNRIGLPPRIVALFTYAHNLRWRILPATCTRVRRFENLWIDQQIRNTLGEPAWTLDDPETIAEKGTHR